MPVNNQGGSVIIHHHSKQKKFLICSLKLAISTALVAQLAGCFSGSKDKLRSDIPETGVAATVQLDLPQTGQKAQIAATVYKDAVAQPLVGGDVLQAKTDQSLATLKAVSNLDGHYSGSLFVDTADTPVDLAVNYDQEASAEDRWFASDELLVNPGPGSLVGYKVEGMTFPQEMVLEAPIANSSFATTSDTIQLNWTPVNEDDQVRLTAAMACTSLGETYRWAYVRSLGIEGQDADASGTYSMTVGELISTVPLEIGLESIANYVAVFVTAVGFGIDPIGLLQGQNSFVTPDKNEGCDIDLTLFRERANTLPASFSGGYAISSRSATVRIHYAP